ncbi:zinc-binding dehydrogenase [Ruania alba]|uniref:NADPH:quinone reductase n=1 Tax=Ruania alba TaxID=648782 RepID=A0A1H5KX43_9MICO|nr:zinc-binding dehydrogenase [Ruania alba]SEE68947.1 NADPH:quinone reductase [Ruania alba]
MSEEFVPGGTMRAALIVERGGPEGRVVGEHPVPEVGPTDVLVRVRACSLNHLDVFVRKGVAGQQLPLPHISGGDIAGEIAAVGSEVSDLQVGQRILIDPLVGGKALGEDMQGGLAEYASVPATNIIPLPDDVDFARAAALPIAYGTARRQLITRGGLQAGETVAILGAAGGLGTGAVLIAKAVGATVIACASSAEKRDRLTELGADIVIDSSAEDWGAQIWKATGKQGVDLMVDNTGAATWQSSIRATKVGGRVVTCGATSGYEVTQFQPYVWVRELDIRGSNGWRREDLEALLEMVRSGELEPVIDREFGLEQIRDAEALLESRSVIGKVVITL